MITLLGFVQLSTIIIAVCQSRYTSEVDGRYLGRKPLKLWVRRFRCGNLQSLWCLTMYFWRNRRDIKQWITMRQGRKCGNTLFTAKLRDYIKYTIAIRRDNTDEQFVQLLWVHKCHFHFIFCIRLDLSGTMWGTPFLTQPRKSYWQLDNWDKNGRFTAAILPILHK